MLGTVVVLVLRDAPSIWGGIKVYVVPLFYQNQNIEGSLFHRLSVLGLGKPITVRGAGSCLMVEHLPEKQLKI